MREIEITKVEPNVTYLKPNEYYVTNYQEGYFSTYLNPKVNYLRLWLKDVIPFEELNENTIFKFECDDIEIDNIRIVESGETNGRYYILCLIPYVTIQNDTNYYDEKFISVLKGKFTISTVFSCDIIQGHKSILERYNNKWPSFHDSEISIYSHCDDFLDLKVCHLISEIYDVHLKLLGTYNVSSKSLFEKLRQNQIVYGIDFRKRNENITILVEFETDIYNSMLERYNREVLIIECKKVEISVELVEC